MFASKQIDEATNNSSPFFTLMSGLIICGVWYANDWLNDVRSITKFVFSVQFLIVLLLLCFMLMYHSDIRDGHNNSPIFSIPYWRFRVPHCNAAFDIYGLEMLPKTRQSYHCLCRTEINVDDHQLRLDVWSISLVLVYRRCVIRILFIMFA
jgi:hypothetical protein